MRRLIVVLVLMCSLIPALHAEGVTAAAPSCADYDAWEWSQSVYDATPNARTALDPDGNGIACDQLPHGGFAPALWTDNIPSDAKPAQLVDAVDGDTFDFRISNTSVTVNLYRADAPETVSTQDCGGSDSTSFATFALGLVSDPSKTYYLEKDTRAKDGNGHDLEYVWFSIDGKPYLLNELMIRSGWAEDTNPSDAKYDTQMRSAETFAKKHNLGVWAECGAFDVSLTHPAEPTAVPYVAPTDVPYVAPTQVPQQNSGCNPNYSPCVPNSPYDLDCPDIGFRVQVIGYDQYNLDADGDGVGCESY